MYNSFEDYITAFNKTNGFYIGQNVNILRKPDSDDGIAHPIDRNKLWSSYYNNNPFPIGNHVVNSVYNTRGLVYVYGYGCLIPFFVIEGYDDSVRPIHSFSKSKFKQFDKLVSEVKDGSYYDKKSQEKLTIKNLDFKVNYKWLFETYTIPNNHHIVVDNNIRYYYD